MSRVTHTVPVSRPRLIRPGGASRMTGKAFRVGTAGLAVAMALLAGCLSLAPQYQRPLLPVPVRYPADASDPLQTGASGPAPPAAATGESAAAVAAIDWRQIFADPRLQAVIATALAHNRDLRVAVLRVQEARALRGVEGSGRFPSLTASADGVRAGLPHGLGLSLPDVLQIYQVAAAASWELDFWGRVRSLDAAALENYLATDAARRAFTVSVAAQVADAWLQQRELDERLRLAHRTLATREESFRIFTRRYQEGAGSKLELTQVETLLTQAQSLVVQLEQSKAVNSHALALLLGEPDAPDAPAGAGREDGAAAGSRVSAVAAGTTLARATDEGAAAEGGTAGEATAGEATTGGAPANDMVAGGAAGRVDPIRLPPAGMPSQLLASRPDVLAAEHRLRAAHASIGAARAAFLPRISLTGTLGTASPQLDGLFDAGTRVWTFIPTLSLPIFSGGQLSANLDLARVRRNIAVADYESTIQSAFRDVSDALASRHWLAEQVAIEERALRAQTERARLAQLRYDSGAAAYIEVLDAQRDLLAAEQGLVQVRRAELSSRVSLFAALGGGTLGAGN